MRRIQQFLKRPRQRGLLPQRPRVGGLGAQHLRRLPDNAVDVEETTAAFADTPEHFVKDRIVNRLRNIAKPGNKMRRVGKLGIP